MCFLILYSLLAHLAHTAKWPTWPPNNAVAVFYRWCCLHRWLHCSNIGSSNKISNDVESGRSNMWGFNFVALLAVARACAHSPEKQNTKLLRSILTFWFACLLDSLLPICPKVIIEWYLEDFKVRFLYYLIKLEYLILEGLKNFRRIFVWRYLVCNFKISTNFCGLLE